MRACGHGERSPIQPGGGGGGLPMPPGIPVGPPPAFGRCRTRRSIPSNPLAAAATPYRPRRAPPPPPQPQRIEVDEMAVQEARKGARKQGLIGGLVVAVVLGAIGYIARRRDRDEQGPSEVRRRRQVARRRRRQVARSAQDASPTRSRPGRTASSRTRSSPTRSPRSSAGSTSTSTATSSPAFASAASRRTRRRRSSSTSRRCRR